MIFLCCLERESITTVFPPPPLRGALSKWKESKGQQAPSSGPLHSFKVLFCFPYGEVSVGLTWQEFQSFQKPSPLGTSWAYFWIFFIQGVDIDMPLPSGIQSGETERPCWGVPEIDWTLGPRSFSSSSPGALCWNTHVSSVFVDCFSLSSARNHWYGLRTHLRFRDRLGTCASD